MKKILGGNDKSSGSSGSTMTMEEAINKHNFYRKVWIERKLSCMDTVEAISEGLSKKVKDIMVNLFVL